MLDRAVAHRSVNLPLVAQSAPMPKTTLAGSRRVRATLKLLSRLPQFRLSDLRHALRLYRTWQVIPYTMLSIPRLSNAYECTAEAIRQHIPGDIAECGVWAGGSTGLMFAAARDSGDANRRFHLFDSFEGLPQPSSKDGKDVLQGYLKDNQDRVLDEGKGDLIAINACAAPRQLAEELFFKVLGAPPDLIIFHQGWFQNTVPAAVASGQVKQLSVLRIDGDWYESTRICLEHLCPLVSPGGFVIIDDYGHFEGCRKAVDEYLAVHGKGTQLSKIDSDGVYFRVS